MNSTCSSCARAPELLGYVQPLTVKAGCPIDVMVSTSATVFDFDVVRLRHGDTNANGPGLLFDEIVGLGGQSVPGRRQRSHLGSFARMPPVASLDNQRTIHIDVVVQAWLPGNGRRQAIMSNLTPDRMHGFALALDEDGALALTLGASTTRVTLPKALESKIWYQVHVEIDCCRRTVELTAASTDRPPEGGGYTRVDRRVTELRDVPSLASPLPLLLAASADAEEPGPLGVGDHFNGKIEDPRITSVLDGDASECIAKWDLGRDFDSARVHDTGPRELHGELVNTPTRGVTGSRWTGSELRFSGAADQYAAIHFHEDDLDDARWKPSSRIALPEDLPSGFYAVRLRTNDAVDFAPFIVSAAAHTRGHVAVVVPTATYVAYANERMIDRFDYQEKGITDHPIVPGDHDRTLAERPDLGKSLYDVHADGSPVTFSTSRRAILNLRPDYRNWLQNAPRHLAADLYLTDWLDHQLIPYEVVTDHDLHAEGEAALAGYHVVVTGSHPEYATARMLDGYQDYLRAGGNLMYLGGNGFYWVTSIADDRPFLAEVRRGPAGTRTSESAPGEGYHSFTAEPGGLWRHRGRAPNVLVGVGFTSQGWDECAPGYRRTEASQDPAFAFVFDGIDDDVIGDFGLIMNGTAGDEIDRLDYALGTPSNAVVLASSTGHSDYYQLALEEVRAATPFLGGSTNELVRSDIAYFDTAYGGAVFSAGSICFTGGLSHNHYDNNVSRLVANVLAEFLIRSHGRGAQSVEYHGAAGVRLPWLR
jgi:N,N-dimethylformamidase